MRLAGAIFAGFLAVICAAPAAAQDYAGQVRSYLEAGATVHESAGYHRDRTIPDVVQPLQLNRPYLWSVYLLEGVNYRVYGACDDDCSDLDMEVYGNDGVFIERDTARDDAPFVQFTAAQTGRYYVRIWLYACAAEPCYVAARVMSGGTPTPRAEGDAR